MNSTYAPGVMLSPQLVAELVQHLRNCDSNLGVPEAAARAVRAWIAGAAAMPPAPPPEDTAPARGYQWKSLFLPSGTELRMSTREDTYHAHVDGDFVVFQGRRYSPHSLLQHLAGSGRNAWRDVWLRFPGERHFLPASRRRREQERVAAGLPPNPCALQFERERAEQAARLLEQQSLAAAASPSSAPQPAALPASQSALDAAPSPAPAHAPDIPAAPPTEADSIAAAAVAMSQAFKSMLALMERLRPRVTPDDERRVNRARRGEDILADHCALD